ncbi:MAG: right-handed parallel beta-helix repeat-containing protein [Saprospiraceae bacterium]|nr:right-handed parallel beta-helix repeat-containing protein [Saprospiraceae bacterium]
MEANSVKNLIVKDCHWSHAGLDGIKLRYNCLNVTITGGSSNQNGLKYGPFDFTKCIQLRANRVDADDGIDCFAGGQYVTIRGTTFERNKGNGITIKSVGGPLPGSDEYCSPIQNYHIENVHTLNNMGYGIVIEGIRDSNAIRSPKLNSVLEDNRARATDIVIKDCSFIDDHASGLFLNGHQITVVGCKISKSCHSGIIIGENTKGIVLKNCEIIGCGKAKIEDSVPHERGLVIEEKAVGITVADCIFDGKNTESGISPLHQLAIYIWESDQGLTKISADQVYILNCISRKNTLSLDGPAFIGRYPGSGYIYIEHKGDLISPEGKILAGLGSKYFSTSINKYFIKTKDEISDRASGWAPF